jgi:hypothetical protein
MNKKLVTELVTGAQKVSPIFPNNYQAKMAQT